ncbi:MAG: hypothetical protein RBT36_03445 [Desulfobulbus sp.]|nr:hypothetical protein [Desulfobulbus sp.]
MSCATHRLDGGPALLVTIHDSSGAPVRVLRRSTSLSTEDHS